MDEDKLRNIVTDYVLPMFPGAYLKPESYAVIRKVDLASINGSNIIMLYPGNNAKYRLAIQRSQPFTRADVWFAAHIMGAVDRTADLKDRPFFDQLLEVLVSQAIANHVSGYILGDEGACVKIIRQLESWASQTYEGQQITASIGFDPTYKVQLAQFWSLFGKKNSVPF